MADIRLPSGRVISNVPKGIGQAQLKELAIASGQFTEDDFEVAQPTTQPLYSEEELARAREIVAQSGSGILDTLQEIPKGIASGAVGMTESAALGAATLLDEEAETGVRDSIKEFVDPIQEYLAPDAGLEDTVTRKFSEALGSFVPLAASGFIPVVGLPVAAGMGVTAGAGEASERAREAGATEDERSTAAGFGSLVGATEVLPVGRLVNRCRKGVGDEVAAEAEGYITRAFKAAGEEGAQEAAATVAQNLIAKNIYDPTTGVFTGSGEAFGYGAGVGGFVQGLLDLVVGRSGGARGPTDTGADGEGVPAPDGRAGVGATAATATDDVEGGVDVPPVTTADTGDGEGVSDSPLAKAKEKVDRAETLLTATQAEFERRVGELEADEYLNITLEQATRVATERNPELVEKIEIARADRDAKNEIFNNLKEAADEQSRQEAEAKAQREQPRTTETIMEKTTPEGETTIETTRTREVKVKEEAPGVLSATGTGKEEFGAALAALETAAGTAPDRPVTRNDPVFMVLEKGPDGKDVAVRKRKEELTPEQIQEIIAKGEDPALFETPAPEPEPETPTLATMAVQHRKDMEANQKGRRRKALKKVATIKKDAGIAYQQAQAKARATVLGRARKQLTDEEIQTRTQTLLDASPELEFLRKAVALEQELNADIAALDKLPLQQT